MVIHVFADGSRAESVKGRKIPAEGFEELYRLVAEISRRGEENDTK